MSRLSTIKPRLAVANLSRAKVPPKTADPWYLTPEHRLWSRAVINRAGSQCEKCGRTGTRLFADHIKEIRDGGELLDPMNGQALCGSCHGAKTHAERNKRWNETTEYAK